MEQANAKLPIMGQSCYTSGERSARLSFVLPASQASTPEMAAVLEDLTQWAGEKGAYGMLAEVAEDDGMIETLRRCGFTVYARQSIWQFPPASTASPATSLWQTVRPVDEFSVRSLYNSLVPPLVQAAEAFQSNRIGYLYRPEDEVLAYVEGVAGPRGIYLQPLIHPGVDDVAALLRNLLDQMLPGRPIYLGIRSYQAWLEPWLERLEARQAPRQALLVKHLTQFQRATVPELRRAVIEGRRAEPTAPIVNQIIKKS